MNWTVVRLGAGWAKAARFAALTVAGGLLAAGCRGGGGGGGGASGITATDEHGNKALDATVIVPDGANMRGQINYGGDTDWFKFRGIQGRSYVLQIEGFPPDPSVQQKYDLTGDGQDFLGAQILDFTGATATGQLENTTGTEGGVPYDISPPGAGTGGLFVVGDSRIFWVCPNTNDYYIVVGHRRQRTGIGSYNIRLASSESSIIRSEDVAFQTNGRFVQIFSQQGELQFEGWMTLGITGTRWEYLDSLNSIIVGIAYTGNNCVILPNQNVCQPYEIGLHSGYPDIYVPYDSSEQAPFGDTHESVATEAVPATFACDATVRQNQSEASLPLPDGSVARIPVTSVDRTNCDTMSGQVEFTLHLDDAVVERDGRDVGAAEFNDPSIRRLLHGFPWYLDVHPMESGSIGAGPVVASLPNLDFYQMFETHFFASSGNVVRSDGSRIPESERGSLGFEIRYDAALKTFQVNMQQYFVDCAQPPSSFVIDPDYADFVGDRVKVHRGAPGETGEVLFDLGTLPEPRLPGFDESVAGDITAEPGFRNPLRQLTDAEASLLRDVFYNDAFYIEVTDRNTDEPLFRAEGEDLEIAAFATAEPCNFPPCSGVVGTRTLPEKGSVTFASELVGAGPIELYANGELLGSLVKTVTTNDLPACGLNNDERSVSIELDPGTYYWHAHGEDGATWDGHFTVTSGECELVVIAPDDLLKK